ncbi:type III pantothenate kinase [Rhodohalobacter sp. 614A]|uniref:type III pantothenate kinase n=1 Tax=Rhodohalobacter sp. 614A TaxID=2908649 RepID=UPI001F33D59B|nr:type III pantothenate kinase [Rhodohalobacter sp. 614A]
MKNRQAKAKKMKELYLDIGNSFLKMATRKNSDWQKIFDGEHERLDELCRIITSYGESPEVRISSVRKDITKRLMQNLPDIKVSEFKTADIPPKMLDYKTPDTLGLDRFLVCLGAIKEASDRNVVVIDAGSACTVDLMTKENVYSGGVIMPGLKMIRNAMEHRLPELPTAPESIPETWPGKSTIESIEWGVNGSFVHAIKGFIHQYRSSVGDIDIFVTGGDASLLLKWMGKDEKLIHRKNLIWTGMEEFGFLIK